MLRVKIVYLTKSCIYLSIVAHRATIRVYNTGLQYGFTIRVYTKMLISNKRKLFGILFKGARLHRS